VHPYEEGQGFQRLLDIPGYDVAALVEKSGKSASHVYARLSLLQLIPAVAEAFTQERITASHANLIARLPQESQAAAFEQCWRKDWQDQDPHLLPAKHLSAWIQTNLYLSLADAAFDREDHTLNPTAGPCTTCPRRSGYKTSLFCDVQGDQCLDSTCYQSKIEAHIERQITAHPDLVQIENGWRSPKALLDLSKPKLPRIKTLAATASEAYTLSIKEAGLGINGVATKPYVSGASADYLIQQLKDEAHGTTYLLGSDGIPAPIRIAD
jgi:hypothetical protein